MLIEHTGGRFPLWLSPDQVILLPISDRFNAYAEEVRDRLVAQGIRCVVDLRNEKIGKKIREAELQRIPYACVVGEREMEQGALAVRARGGKDLGSEPVESFIRRINDELAHSLEA